MRLFLLLLLFVTSLNFGNAQIKFVLAYDAILREDSNDSLTKLQFYISDLRASIGKHVVWRAEKKHYLIDLNTEDDNNNSIDSDLLVFREGLTIQFLLGVDSKTASKGIGEGALDPINGMYWTWQSGYINFKMEGISKKSPTRKNRFQLHLGGYNKPWATQQEVSLQTSSKETIICFNLERFLSLIDLRQEHTIMSPCEKGVMLSALAKTCFYAQ
tara:strand:+ start:5189 stop:5833 length:645 start_codon:yes stop_codon:yes gene_type:complete